MSPVGQSGKSLSIIEQKVKNVISSYAYAGYQEAISLIYT